MSPSKVMSTVPWVNAMQALRATAKGRGKSAAGADLAGDARRRTNAPVPLDTSPDCARPKQRLIDAAKENLPDLLSSMSNIEEGYNERPSPPDRLVSAEKMVQALIASGHLDAAARHAIHQLIQEGMLDGEAILRGVPTTSRLGSGKSGMSMLEEESPTETPVFGGPIPYSELLIRSTPALWDRWRGEQATTPDATPSAGVKAPASEQPEAKGKTKGQERVVKNKGAKKTRSRRSRIAELLLAFLDDQRNTNLNCSELAEKLECDVSSISRAFRHKKYGPEILRRYRDRGKRPPGIHQI